MVSAASPGPDMTKSPLVLSAALHLGILLLISLAAGGRRPPVVPPVPLYLDLASLACSGSAAAAPRPATRRAPARPSLVAASPPVREPASEKGEEPEQPAGAQPAAAAGEPQGMEISRAFAGAARRQAMAHNTRDYLDSTGKAVQKLLEGTLASGELERFAGEKAAVQATYGSGELQLVSVTAGNQEMGRALHDGVAWAKVPAPEKYFLSFHQVTFLVSLEKGRINVGISPQ